MKHDLLGLRPIKRAHPNEVEKERRKRLAAIEAQEKKKPALFTDVGGRKIRGAPIPKPCPFCGSNKWVSVYMQIEGKNGARSVYAATCGNRHFVEGPGGPSQIEACKLWNKRATPRTRKREAGVFNP